VDKNVLTPKAVFDRAHELLSPAEQQAYLDEVCAGEPDLRQKVEALLRAYEDAGSFLEKPALEEQATGPYWRGGKPVGPTSDSAETIPPRPAGMDEPAVEDRATVLPRPPGDVPPLLEGPGTRIGPYRLIEELGHGGMGAVYLAGQEEPVRRQVALKIIKPGMDSHQVVARFEAERQALALMDHANIAKVFDAGATATGRPFFVMELVQGVPLTRFCDDHQLTPRQRLELFIPVCQAIQHAHQKGIIHRDIKPSNVLVSMQDAKPVPKVIDFGIAKATEQPLTDKTLATQFGTVIGTLEYMSPEQADYGAQGIDTRSDVYSLGVLLYELLTGTTPIDRERLRNAGFPGVLMLIQDEEPPRPSTRLSKSGEHLTEVSAQRKTEPAKLVKLLRGDLDWIVMKCLEKDRNRRYETASALARDIERYLHDEPVEACPPSTSYRLKKFARKHRMLLATLAGFMALLLLGVVGLAVGIIAINQARERAVSAQKRTRAALDASDAVVDTLIRSKPQLGDVEIENVRKVLENLEQLVPDLVDTPEARATAAEAHLRMGKIYGLIDERAKAETHYRGGIHLYEQLAAEDPRERRHWVALARSFSNLGFLLADQKKRRAEAEAAYRRAIEVDEKLVGDFPTWSGGRRELADALNDFGVFLKDGGQLAAAEGAYRRAIRLGEKLTTQLRTVPRLRVNLAATYGNLGNVVRDQRRPEAALIWYGKAVALLSPIVAKDPRAVDPLRFLRNFHWDRANALGQLGRHTEAIADWQRACQLNTDPADGNRLLRFEAAARAEERLQGAMLGKNAPASGSVFYETACACTAAACAALGNDDSLHNQYTDRARALLQMARDAGFFRDSRQREQLKKNRAIDWLRRRRPDFHKFVVGLETATEPKRPK
jgi:serine/threonine protein kinase/tetratricopeptide (TPR) repeat protein